MNRKSWLILPLIILLNSTLCSLDRKFITVISHNRTPVANNIKVLDQYAYVYNDWYLYIFSIKNYWKPTIETAFISTYPITDVETLTHNHVFICSDEPANVITEIDSLNIYGRIYTAQHLVGNQAKREGSLLFTSHRQNGLEIYDISKGTYPQKITSYSEDWGIVDLSARFPTVHALNDFGYVNIDISDISAPRTVGLNYEIVDGKVLYVNRNIAWVASGSTLLAVEVTYPDEPVIINRYRFSADINDIKARGNELFVGLKTSGLRILDISNPREIEEKNSFYLKRGVKSIALDGDYIFLGAGVKGWFILRYR